MKSLKKVLGIGALSISLTLSSFFKDFNKYNYKILSDKDIAMSYREWDPKRYKEFQKEQPRQEHKQLFLDIAEDLGYSKEQLSEMSAYNLTKVEAQITEYLMNPLDIKPFTTSSEEDQKKHEEIKKKNIYEILKPILVNKKENSIDGICTDYTHLMYFIHKSFKDFKQLKNVEFVPLSDGFHEWQGFYDGFRVWQFDANVDDKDEIFDGGEFKLNPKHIKPYIFEWNFYNTFNAMLSDTLVLSKQESLKSLEALSDFKKHHDTFDPYNLYEVDDQFAKILCNNILNIPDDQFITEKEIPEKYTKKYDFKAEDIVISHNSMLINNIVDSNFESLKQDINSGNYQEALNLCDDSIAKFKLYYEMTPIALGAKKYNGNDFIIEGSTLPSYLMDDYLNVLMYKHIILTKYTEENPGLRPELENSRNELISSFDKVSKRIPCSKQDTENKCIIYNLKPEIENYVNNIK